MGPLLFATGTADRKPPEIIDDPTVLVDRGFTSNEVTSLIWLRQRYQTGGSDRAVIVRYLEFMRYLIQTRKMEP